MAVAAVLIHLRNSAEDDITGDRNWLIGRVEAEAGLRREEVSKLSLPALEAALAKEGIRIIRPQNLDDARNAGWAPSLSNLDSIADWEIGRKGILEGLDHLQRRNRTNIYIRVPGSQAYAWQQP